MMRGHPGASSGGYEQIDSVLDDARADASPIFPGKHHLDWDLPNRDGKSLNEVRAIREEIDLRVQQLLERARAANSRAGNQIGDLASTKAHPRRSNRASGGSVAAPGALHEHGT